MRILKFSTEHFLPFSQSTLHSHMHLYTGKFDLTFTALQIPFLGICSGLFATGTWRDVPWTENTIILVLGIFGVVSLGLSLVLACRANRSAWMALLVFPLKYIYATVLIGLGIIAICVGVILFPQEVRNEKHIWEHMTKTGGGAVLLRCLARWNRRLIRPVDILEESEQTSDMNPGGGEGTGALRD